MSVRVFALAACLATLPLSFARADEIPEPPSVPMGPVQNGDPDAHPSQHTGESDTSAIGSAAAAAANPNDEADQNAVGSEFDGSASHDGDPDEPAGTHVEENGEP